MFEDDHVLDPCYRVLMCVLEKNKLLQLCCVSDSRKLSADTLMIKNV